MSAGCEEPRTCECKSCALGRLFVGILDYREGRGSKERVDALVAEFGAAPAPVAPEHESGQP